MFTASGRGSGHRFNHHEIDRLSKETCSELTHRSTHRFSGDVSRRDSDLATQPRLGLCAEWCSWFGVAGNYYFAVDG